MHVYFKQFNTSTYANPNFGSKKEVIVKKTLTEFQKKKSERENVILQKLLAGFSRKEIAKELGIKLAKVIEVAEKNNVFKTMIAQRTARIIAKLKQGISVAQIAIEEGVNCSTVTRTAQKENFKIPRGSNANTERNNRIAEDLKQKVSIKEIMQKYGASEAHVIRIKNSLGLTKKYNYLPKPQTFRYFEIKEQSRNITTLRKAMQRFKNGERTPEVLAEMEKTLDVLKAKIKEFKSRIE